MKPRPVKKEESTKTTPDLELGFNKNCFEAKCRGLKDEIGHLQKVEVRSESKRDHSP